MTTTDTTSACPDWCQSKPHDDPDGHDGPSWPDVDVPSMCGTGGHAVEISAGAWNEQRTVVHLEAQSLNLTPEQARAAGLALLSAASWAKDHQIG
jgi:hypothetical protein